VSWDLETLISASALATRTRLARMVWLRVTAEAGTAAATAATRATAHTMVASIARGTFVVPPR